VETRLMTASGESRSVRLYVSLMRDADGQPTHIVGRMVDLTELKRLLSAQASMIDSALDAILGMDGEGT